MAHLRLHLFLLLFFLCVRGAEAQSGGPYSLQWSIDAGGGMSSGGSYMLVQSVAQSDAGRLNGGTYVLVGGIVDPAASTPTAVTDEAPTSFRLLGFAPNPFTSSTALFFELPKSSPVHIAVMGIDGRLVRRLYEGALPAGRHQVIWNGLDDRNRAIPAGVYFVTVQAEARMLRQRVVHVR